MEFRKQTDKELQTEEITIIGEASEIIEVLKYLSEGEQVFSGWPTETVTDTVNIKAGTLDNPAEVESSIERLEQRMKDAGRAWRDQA